MAHFEAKMSSKGQVTVPAAVREFLRLKEGDVVDFYVDERSHKVEIIARNRSLSELFGTVKAGAQIEGPVTVEEMNEAIGDHLAEKHERISREWNEWREFQEWKKARASEAAE